MIDIAEQIACVQRAIEDIERLGDDFSAELPVWRAVLATLEKVAAEEPLGRLQ